MFPVVPSGVRPGSRGCLCKELSLTWTVHLTGPQSDLTVHLTGAQSVWSPSWWREQDSEASPAWKMITRLVQLLLHLQLTASLQLGDSTQHYISYNFHFLPKENLIVLTFISPILRDITVRQYGQRTSFLQQIFLHNSLFHKQCISPYFSPSLSHSFNFHLSIHYTIDPVVLEGSMHYTYLVIMIRMDTHYYFQFYDFQFFLSSWY